MPPKEGQPVDVGSLAPQQLAAVREQLQAELQTLAQSAVALQKAAGSFGGAGIAMEKLGEQKPGQPMMVPLTESLYVAGALDSTDSVLLDIGTGYFVERSVKDGVDFCKRKVTMLRDNLEKLAQAQKDKQQMLMMVDSVYSRKMRAAGQPTAASK